MSARRLASLLLARNRALQIKLRILRYRVLSNGRTPLDAAGIAGPVLVTGLGTVSGKGARFGYWPSPRFFDGYIHLEARGAGSEIVLGPGSIVNNGTTMVANDSFIRVGPDCLIGPEVQIFDSDFHDLHPELRKSGEVESAGVTIERNVFLGARVIVLKGVTIGADSVIGAGSVVVADIPPGVVAGGNPCRVIAGVPGSSG